MFIASGFVRFYIYLLCVCVCGGACAFMHVCMRVHSVCLSQRTTCESQSSPSSTWILGAHKQASWLGGQCPSPTVPSHWPHPLVLTLNSSGWAEAPALSFQPSLQHSLPQNHNPPSLLSPLPSTDSHHVSRWGTNLLRNCKVLNQTSFIDENRK